MPQWDKKTSAEAKEANRRRGVKHGKTKTRSGPKHPRDARRTIIPTGKKYPSERHMRVIDHYFENGFVQERAMLAAGYSKSTAHYMSWKIFSREEVCAEINRRLEKVEKKREITVERIIAEYAKIAFLDLSNALVREAGQYSYLDASKLTDEQVSALAGFETEEYKEGRGPSAQTIIKVKIKLSDKKAALDSLARIKGMFNDKLDVTGHMSIVERLQKGRERVKKDNGEARDDGHSDATH